MPEPRAVGELIIDAEVDNLGVSATRAGSPWRKLANVLWRRRGVVGASIVAMVVIGGIYLLAAPQSLQTSATVRVHVLDQLLPDSAATGSNTLAEQPGDVAKAVAATTGGTGPRIVEARTGRTANADLRARMRAAAIRAAGTATRA